MLQQIKEALLKYLDTKTNERLKRLLGGSTWRNCIIVVPILCKQALYIIYLTQLELMLTHNTGADPGFCEGGCTD